MKKIAFLSIIFSLVLLASCKKEKLNLFSVDDDIEFGKQVAAEIAANPTEYPVLKESDYPLAYAHLKRIRDEILKSTDIEYKDRFAWNVTIIKKDDVINAFSLPGGDTYYYTGLIKFLDDEAQFAGVMAHEFAHSDRRHSTSQLTKAYGLQVLTSILLGDSPSQAAEIAAGLASGLSTLAFSRSNEYDADEYAVKYLYPLDYDARGVADFFIKLDQGSQSIIVTYLSTHPSPEDRIEKINELWTSLGGKVGEKFPQRYQEFKNSLP